MGRVSGREDSKRGSKEGTPYTVSFSNKLNEDENMFSDEVY